MMQINISEVAEELKLSKVDDQSWGFRVTGGLDFGTPLTVIKVMAGSLAEQAGLKVGDILLQANGKPLSYLTHHESSNLLKEAGNFIELSVVRGSLVMPPTLTSPEPLSEAAVIDENITDEEVQQHNENAEKNVDDQPPKPKEPTLFETIFGPLDEPPTERCKSAFEELVEDLLRQQGQGEDVTPEYETCVQTSLADQNPETAMQEQPTDSENAVEGAATSAPNAVISPIVAADSAAESTTAGPTLLKTELETTSQQEAAVATVAESAVEEPVPPEIELEAAPQVEDKIQQPLDQKPTEVTEEELNEFMLGHAEVLKGTTIGVDFEKMIVPNTHVIEHSDVLQILKELDKQSEVKKLSTFLVQPNRPKMKPKEKPKKTETPSKQAEIKSQINTNEETGENPEQTTFSEIDESKELEKTTENEEQSTGTSTEDNLTKVKGLSSEEQELGDNEITPVPTSEETNNKEQHTKSGIEMEPEDKLTAIQKQLALLLQLPTIMGQQLTMIQQEINNIVQQKETELHQEAILEDNAEVAVEETERELKDVQKNENQENQEASENQEDAQEEVKNESTEEIGQNVGEEDKQDGHDEQIDANKTLNPLEVQETSTEDQSPNNDDKTDTEERKHDIKWQHEKPKRNKPFFPLTPHPRPIVLPGRIKFQMNPEEAYNDEFIAETLSGNAELIMGTTIGNNFKKYKRCYDHLKSSSVYRMIHESENVSVTSTGQQENLIAAEHQ